MLGNAQRRISVHICLGLMVMLMLGGGFTWEQPI
jgi:hypothetical protein